MEDYKVYDIQIRHARDCRSLSIDASYDIWRSIEETSLRSVAIEWASGWVDVYGENNVRIMKNEMVDGQIKGTVI